MSEGYVLSAQTAARLKELLGRPVSTQTGATVASGSGVRQCIWLNITVDHGDGTYDATPTAYQASDTTWATYDTVKVIEANGNSLTVGQRYIGLCAGIDATPDVWFVAFTSGIPTASGIPICKKIFLGTTVSAFPISGGNGAIFAGMDTIDTATNWTDTDVNRIQFPVTGTYHVGAGVSLGDPSLDPASGSWAEIKLAYNDGVICAQTIKYAASPADTNKLFNFYLACSTIGYFTAETQVVLWINSDTSSGLDVHGSLAGGPNPNDYSNTFVFATLV